jgi:hypothetical protein
VDPDSTFRGAPVSDVPAYNGIHEPTAGGDFAERLMYVPSVATVIDFIYFSTVTTATVGTAMWLPFQPGKDSDDHSDHFFLRACRRRAGLGYWQG